ncbi:unnamed protein product, partial [marine sediment metagenome]
MNTIIKINFKNYSENATVLSLDCVVDLVNRMKKDSDFVSFEIVQEGDDIDLVKAILFGSSDILKIEVHYTQKSRETTAKYENYAGQTIVEWKQIIKVYFSAYIVYNNTVSCIELSTKCRYKSDIKTACYKTI